MNTVCLILKAPREGTVKTRLARDIGAHRAAAIYRALVERQVCALPEKWGVAVYFAPGDAGSEMEMWLRPRLPASARFAPQCDGDLGQRLADVVRAEFQRGARHLFLIGGDCPGINREYFAQADQYLDIADIAIGPAVDGGYVLMGLKAPHVALFENIAWSTVGVLEQTTRAAERLALTVGFLKALEDVDDWDSLMRQSKLFAMGEDSAGRLTPRQSA